MRSKTHLFPTMYSVSPQDWSAPRCHPDPSQSIAVNFIFLNHTLSFFMLNTRSIKSQEKLLTANIVYLVAPTIPNMDSLLWKCNSLLFEYIFTLFSKKK